MIKITPDGFFFGGGLSPSLKNFGGSSSPAPPVPTPLILTRLRSEQLVIGTIQHYIPFLIRTIMSFLDEVEKTEQDTVVSRARDTKTFAETSSVNASLVSPRAAETE